MKEFGDKVSVYIMLHYSIGSLSHGPHSFCSLFFQETISIVYFMHSQCSIVKAVPN